MTEPEEKSGEIVEQGPKIPGHPNLKPFPKGYQGGPGRPPGRKNLKTIVREILETKAPRAYVEKLRGQGIEITDESWETVLTTVALAKAASGSIQHLREIWDRRDGKPRQAIDLDAKTEARVLIGLPPVKTIEGEAHGKDE